MPTKETRARNEECLPEEAFAIVGDPEDPATWKLPHHSRAILRALAGRVNIERTVDWGQMSAAVAAPMVGPSRSRALPSKQ